MIIYIVLSFFLENIVGLLINKGIIIPMFFLLALLLLYQVKSITYDKYLLYMVLLGFLYDIIYTNVYINSLLFLSIGSLNILYDKYINNSFITNFLFIILSLVMYEVLCYFVYIMLGLNNFNILVLGKSILAILPVNIIYYLISKLYLSKYGR